MKPNRTLTGIMLLAALAFLGYLLVTVPPRLVEIYRTANELGWVFGAIYLLLVGVGGVLLLGVGGNIVWRLWKHSASKRKRRVRDAKNPSALSEAERRDELQENLGEVAGLTEDVQLSDDMRQRLQELSDALKRKQEDKRLEIVAFGSISSGKSSLLNSLAGREVFPTDAKGGTTVTRNEIPWPGMDQVVLVNTPGLGEIDGAAHAKVSADAAKDSDLVLVVVDGPLRETEHDLLERLGQMEKRVVVCLNKEDWYEPRDRQRLLEQLTKQVAPFVAEQDVVAVRSRPTERLRVRVLPDGSQVEEMAPVPEDIAKLAERMMRIVKRDGQDLLMANLLLQSRGLVDDARLQVRDALDARAWQLVDRYTWGAGGAAALSPVPILDLMAGSAITAKMVVDLARIYRQNLDMEAAMDLLGQLGKNLIAILGVNLAGPAITAGVASVLKAVPGAGWIVGGILQGAVQAFVTRWIGSVFVAYFRDELKKDEKSALASLARREWNRLTTIDELRRFVQAARRQLTSDD